MAVEVRFAPWATLPLFRDEIEKEHAAGTDIGSDRDQVVKTGSSEDRRSGLARHTLERREIYGEIIDAGQLSELGEALNQQVVRYVASPTDFEDEETEQPQRDSNPCRHLERVVS
jgi:hypothetical protein